MPGLSEDIRYHERHLEPKYCKSPVLTKGAKWTVILVITDDQFNFPKGFVYISIA